MQPKFRSEQIYDAALDDDCFANLPSLLNQAYGARSCTLHWRHDRYDAEVMAHSGYFSDAQLQDYTENFTGSDLWSLAGLHPDRANQVWNCDELVPVSTYEKTAFYNDWIRAMGDDTYHCIGIAMQTQWGFGFIGLHRGRTQGSFSEEHVRALKDDVSHLGRMLMMRGRLTSADRMAVQRKAMVDVVGHAMMLVSDSGHIVDSNAAAEGLLGRRDGLFLQRGMLRACSSVAQSRLDAAIGRATARSGGEASGVTIPRPAGGELALSVIGAAIAGGLRQAMIIAAPVDADPSLEGRLRDLFGLSRGEALLAVRLSEGMSPADIADERRVALTTVRTQIKSVAAKLGCGRQSEIVAIVKSLPPLSAER